MQNDIPFLIQGSEDPVFRCEVECASNFLCSKCTHLLIENYFPENYVGIGIQCFRCQHISFTPTDLNGEVFSINTITIGDIGKFLITSTVITGRNSAITCDNAQAEALKLMAPRDAIPIEFSLAGLAAAIDIYERLAPGILSIQENRLARTDDREAILFPFAWSIRYLKRCFAERTFDIDRLESQTALLWLKMFLDAVGSWQHHPRFHSVAKDLAKRDSFLHTAGQLMVAKYLFKEGIPVGFSLEDKIGEPNPDLYVRTGFAGNVYLEVKAPQKLQTFNEAPGDLRFLKGVLKSTIDGTKKQINKSRKGALIIISTLYDKESAQVLQRLAKNWLVAHGRNRTSLAAIIVMAVNEHRTRRLGEQSFGHVLSFSFLPLLNPHFDGKNPISTARANI